MARAPEPLRHYGFGGLAKLGLRKLKLTPGKGVGGNVLRSPVDNQPLRSPLTGQLMTSPVGV